MATKASTKKKVPEKKKRATPVKFHDEKIDSIVKEITEGLKSDGGSKEKLEEEVAREIAEKRSEAKATPEETASEVIEEPEEKKEEKEEKEDRLEIEQPFSEEQNEEASEQKEEKEKEKEEENNSDNESKDEKEVVPTNPAPVFAPRDDNPFPPLENEKKRSLKWPIIYLILFVGGMVTGFIIFDQLSTRGNTNLFSFATPTPTPTPMPTPTPTPEEVDLSAYKIKVENGSGIAGEAAKLQKALEDENFTVSDIGNADKSTYTKTVIQVKNGTNTQFLTKLKEALKKTYDVDDQTVTLPDSESVDAVVIIGSKKASE